MGKHATPLASICSLAFYHQWRVLPSEYGFLYHYSKLLLSQGLGLSAAACPSLRQMGIQNVGTSWSVQCVACWCFAFYFPHHVSGHVIEDCRRTPRILCLWVEQAFSWQKHLVTDKTSISRNRNIERCHHDYCTTDTEACSGRRVKKFSLGVGPLLKITKAQQCSADAIWAQIPSSAGFRIWAHQNQAGRAYCLMLMAVLHMHIMLPS